MTSKPIIPQPRQTMPKSNIDWMLPIMVLEFVALAAFIAWAA